MNLHNMKSACHNKEGHIYWPRKCKPLALQNNARSRLAASKHTEAAQQQQKSRDVPREDVEADPRYARVDFSNILAYQARLAFAEAIRGGEPSMRLAEAALWASAEDDAVASHTTVPFPVASYQQRITQITQHVRQQLSLAGLLVNQRAGHTVEPDTVIQVVEKALFNQPPHRPHSDHTQTTHIASWGLKAPEHGRSALPWGVTVDHAGTWEQARDAYLHEVLIRRSGHPAALAIIYAQVMSELLADGSVDFSVTMKYGTYDDPPMGVLLPGVMTKSRGAAAGHPHPVRLLNTCSSDVLAELQRHLKRAYWCWAWDTRIDAYEHDGNNSLGGFRAAAKAAVGDEMSAAIAAISTVAAWRLDRGIWTSPGAGDIKRATTAASRLVLLEGDERPEERRDLAVLLMHGGQLGAAYVELETYMSTQSFIADADPFDKALCYRLIETLRKAGDALHKPKGPLTVQSTLESPAPGEDDRKLPLTW